MKKFLYITLAMFATVLFGTGCNQNESKVYYSSIVTLIDGSYDYAYSVEFDDGKTAYVTNSFSHHFTFSDKLNGEGRAYIWYEVADEKKPGFDHSLTLVSLEPLSTFKLISINDPDVTDLDKFTASAYISEMAYAMNRDYLTMAVIFPASTTGNYSHQMQLLYNDNPEHEGAYQEYYPTTDDGYLYLELYHNSNGDPGSTNTQAIACYKVDYNNLHGMQPMSDYKGIKVIQPVQGGRVEIYTYDFPKQ